MEAVIQDQNIFIQINPISKENLQKKTIGAN